MKYPTRNNAKIQGEIQSVFSEKVIAEIRIKLRQLAEIEYLYHTQKKILKKK